VANVTRDDVTELIELAAAIPIRTRTTIHGLDDVNQALADLAAGRVSGAAVVQMS
jgi:propanol-preferring alcohol dehydrogenase